MQDSPVVDTSSVNKYIKQYEQILQIAEKISSKIVVQSLLPVIENKFPNQKYLDEPKWIFNINVIEFNKLLKTLAQKYHAQYVDTYSVFNKQNLSTLYFDAVHPNGLGQTLLFDIYTKEFNK